MKRNILCITLALALAAVTPALAQRSNAPRSVSPGAVIGAGPTYLAPYVQAEALVQGAAVTGWKGFKTFSHPTTGVYCLTLSSVATIKSAPVVSIEWGDSYGVALFAQWDQSGFYCGTSTNVIEIQTYKADSGGVGSSLQTPVLSDEVAFVVMLP